MPLASDIHRLKTTFILVSVGLPSLIWYIHPEWKPVGHCKPALYNDATPLLGAAANHLLCVKQHADVMCCIKDLKSTAWLGARPEIMHYIQF